MNIGAAFPSNYLKAEEFLQTQQNPGGDLTFTCSHVELEKMQGDQGEDEKPVLYFHESDKGLVLNKTNATAIASQHGQETDNWNGKLITLYATEVQFGKQTMLGLRVRLRANPSLMAPNTHSGARPGAAAEAAMQKSVLNKPAQSATPANDARLNVAKSNAYKGFITAQKTSNPAATEQQIILAWKAALQTYFGSTDAAKAATAEQMEQLLADGFISANARQTPGNIDPSEIPF